MFTQRTENQSDEKTKHVPLGSLPTNQAPEQRFTGEVAISDYVERAAPSRLVSATVSFAPGARTPWKVNPLGQQKNESPGGAAIR